MIRSATIDDLPTLLALGEAMHAESPRFAKMAFSAARLEETLRALILLPRGFVVVAEIGGEIVGGMVAVCMTHWASEDLLATDLALFVRREHRGGLTAARLVRRYAGWAMGEGAKLIQLGVTTGVATDETAAMYEAIGLRRCGVILEV